MLTGSAENALCKCGQCENTGDATVKSRSWLIQTHPKCKPGPTGAKEAAGTVATAGYAEDKTLMREMNDAAIDISGRGVFLYVKRKT